MREKTIKFIGNGILLAALVSCISTVSAAKYNLKSPNNDLKISFNYDKNTLSYSINVEKQKIIDNAIISLTVDGKKLPYSNKQPEIKRNSINKFVKLPVKTINNGFADSYNRIVLTFQNNIAIEARAYNEGVAFRWISNNNKNKELFINKEQHDLSFNKSFAIYYPQLDGKNFISNQENSYHYFSNMNKIGGKLAKLEVPTPMLITINDNKKMLISEANLEAYPGWYVKKANMPKNKFSSEFPKYPLKLKARGVRSLVPSKYADYIAKVPGNKEFPWRAFLVDSDKDLIVNQLIYKLSEPSRIKDCSWIKPSKVAWDWWHALNIARVPFKSGINTQTYKYYIDFAAKSGSKYIIMDAGWSKNKDQKETLLEVVKELNMQEVVDYGKKRGVGVILWTTALALDYNFDKAFKQFSKWGIKGLKIDYLVRDDQTMVEFVYKVMAEAAKRKMIVDFHGGYKPTGVSRTYPNFMTCESVKGLEQSKWSTSSNPNYTTLLPFIRNVVGPMDYTPGAMKNYHLNEFVKDFKSPASIGTRCQQLGMYVVYFSSIQMLSDSPTNYYNAPLALEFLKAVPTVWDKSVGMAGKVGQYAAVARKDGDNWFIGGINNYNEREITVKFDFLDDKQNYNLKLYKDGSNVKKDAKSMDVKTYYVKKGDVMKIKMATGGGFAGILEKK